MEVKRIALPLTKEAVADLRAGDAVLLSGTLYTGRDAAHKRLMALLEENRPLPLPIAGETIYYVGPSPTPPGFAVGAAGPTTSYRMDDYTVPLLRLGLRGMIGKGRRSEAVKEAVVRYGAVYFAAVGGAAALIAQSVVSAEVVCYEDLGAEAIHRFTVRDFPAVVVLDAFGGDQYEAGKKEWAL